MNVDKWDLVIYDAPCGIDNGAVLRVFPDGDVRTDTDGVLSYSDLRYVVKDAGKQFIWDSYGYCSDPGYQKYLLDTYGLEINPSRLVLI